MDFYDYQNDTFLAFNIFAFDEHTKLFTVSIRYALEEKVFRVEEADFLALAKWLEFPDIQSQKDISFRNVPLKFEYGHFEKGELYYQITYEGTKIYTYEQLGGSNLLRIKTLEDGMLRAKGESLDY